MPKNSKSQKIADRLQYERALYERGYRSIAGVDEVGRGALAGPVTAGAVIFPVLNAVPDELNRLRDSKKMTAALREQMVPAICGIALAAAVGHASAREIDQLGIVRATALAMQRALAQLQCPYDALLVDAIAVPGVETFQKAVIGGDDLSLSIAAASVVAKVARDHHMNTLASNYPAYGFAGNKGYGTKEHILALRRGGICAEHRATFTPIPEIVKNTGAITNA